MAAEEEPIPRITKEYRDNVYKPTHLGLRRYGTIPTGRIENTPGAMGEIPGEHRRFKGPLDPTGSRWEEFKSDIRDRGIQHGIFVTVEPGGPGKDDPSQPVTRISEGNHRRDAAVELGMKEVPVEVAYYGGTDKHDTLFRDRRE